MTCTGLVVVHIWKILGTQQPPITRGCLTKSIMAANAFKHFQHFSNVCRTSLEPEGQWSNTCSFHSLQAMEMITTSSVAWAYMDKPLLARNFGESNRNSKRYKTYVDWVVLWFGTSERSIMSIHPKALCRPQYFDNLCDDLLFQISSYCSFFYPNKRPHCRSVKDKPANIRSPQDSNCV